MCYVFYMCTAADTLYVRIYKSPVWSGWGNLNSYSVVLPLRCWLTQHCCILALAPYRILTLQQAARLMVHSFPYVPDSLLLMDIIHHSTSTAAAAPVNTRTGHNANRRTVSK